MRILTEKKIDSDGFELDFEKINADPIEFYDDTIGDLITQDVYQIARKGKMKKISIIKSSKTKGNEIIRMTVGDKEIKNILYGLPEELTFGLSQTRDEFRKEVESWNAKYNDSKLFIVDSDALPIYCRGNIIQEDEVKISYVVGKLLPIYENFPEANFVGQNPFGIFFAIPESFVFVFDKDINVSVSFQNFKQIKSVGYLNKIYQAATKVFCERSPQEFQVCNAIFNIIGKRSRDPISKLSYIIFDKNCEIQYSNIKDIDGECLRNILKALPRVRDELGVVMSDIIVGGDSNCYAMGFTDEGTIAIKNDLAYLPYMKTEVFATNPNIV